MLRRAFDLSLAIYRVTALFPAGEVLARQMRELGNEIAAECAAGNCDADLQKKIEKILLYFEIAREQSWVRSMNWTALSFEYRMLRQEVDFFIGQGSRQETVVDNIGKTTHKSVKIMSHNIEDQKKRVVNRPSKISEHQEKILVKLRDKKALRMSEIIPLFKYQVSERTLRTALQDLVNQGVVKKNGSRKSTIYSVV